MDLLERGASLTLLAGYAAEARAATAGRSWSAGRLGLAGPVEASPAREVPA